MPRERIYYENKRNGEPIKYPGCWFYESEDGDDRTYYATYRKDGKLITAKCGRKNKGCSLRKCSVFRADLMRGKAKTRQQEREEAGAAKARRIGYLFDKYKVEKNRGTKDDNLFELYVEPFYKGLDIQACTNKDTERHAGWLKEQPGKSGNGLKPQSRKHALALFRRIYWYSVKQERIEHRITDFSIPTVKNTVTEQLDDRELAAYVHLLRTDIINRPVCDMMLLALCTGMRQGEILALRWTDIDWKKNIIKVRNPKGDKLRGEKDSPPLEIPMNKDARAILERQPKRSMIIFCNKKGKKRYSISKQAKRLRDKAGLPKSFRPFHALRHVFATKLAEADVSIEIISKMLGHADISTTMRYVEVADKRKHEAAALMNVVGIGGKK